MMIANNNRPEDFQYAVFYSNKKTGTQSYSLHFTLDEAMEEQTLTLRLEKDIQSYGIFSIQKWRAS